MQYDCSPSIPADSQFLVLVPSKTARKDLADVRAHGQPTSPHKRTPGFRGAVNIFKTSPSADRRVTCLRPARNRSFNGRSRTCAPRPRRAPGAWTQPYGSSGAPPAPTPPPPPRTPRGSSPRIPTTTTTGPTAATPGAPPPLLLRPRARRMRRVGFLGAGPPRRRGAIINLNRPLRCECWFPRVLLRSLASALASGPLAIC